MMRGLLRADPNVKNQFRGSGSAQHHKKTTMRFSPNEALMPALAVGDSGFV